MTFYLFGFWATLVAVVTSLIEIVSVKMATEPNKTEILTIFKRLRSVPTNKVTEYSPSLLVYYFVRLFYTGSP